MRTELKPGQEESRLAAGSSLMESYHFERQPNLDRELYMRFASGDLIDAGENGIIFGGWATGKTHLGHALAQSAAKMGRTVRIVTPSTQLTKGTWATLRAHSAEELKDDLVDCDFLLVNDLPRSDDYGRDLFLLLESRCLARRSTFVVASSLPRDLVASDVFRDWSRGSELLGRGACGNHTVRGLWALGVGLYIDRSQPISQPYMDRLKLPRDARAESIVRDLHFASPEWLPTVWEEVPRCHQFRWHLFYLDRPGTRNW